jgi:Helix-turn-helix domain
MQGRKPLEYRLHEADRQYLHELLADGQVMQRVAHRARALLALDRGERIVEIVHWLGWSRMGLWYLWQRYQQYGVEAILDAERSGRPPVFSPAGARPDRAHGLH